MAPSVDELQAGIAEMSLKSNPSGGIHPLGRLPCAHCDISNTWECPKSGTLPCSSCHLVSYCSKTCQEKHWSSHKRDCKDPLLSAKWKPLWEVQKRKPSFVNNNTEWDNMAARIQYGLRKQLWGGTPAIDVLKLGRNEGKTAPNRDFSVAFIASGDLRDLIHTVNEMPDNYSGKLTVLLNDKEPLVAIRNLVILLVLGMEKDNARAAEIALHLWYSAFVPATHLAVVVSYILPVVQELKKSAFSLNLGGKSTLSAFFPPGMILGVLLPLVLSSYTFEDAQEEFQRVFLSPQREDLRDRTYIDMEPSHRLAMDYFRRFGLLLPFGAPNAHFSQPNRFLFSENCEWLQYDGASPLDGWDVPSVIASGKTHGAHRADIIGCLYFYVSDQLRTFADRVRRFKISFHLFSGDAGDVATILQLGAPASAGLPPQTVFDRVDVSNIIDNNYLGIGRVLSTWGPLLNKTNKHATILCSFLNWFLFQPNSSVSEMSEMEFMRFMTPLMQAHRRGEIATPSIFNKLLRINVFDALYDNSPAFLAYLNREGLAYHARNVDLTIKSKHSILPHRSFGLLDADFTSLPHFPDEESIYLNLYMPGHMLKTRYVELGPL